MLSHHRLFLRSSYILTGLVLALVMLQGCAGQRPITATATTVIPGAETPPVAPVGADSVLWAMYEAGVEAAKYPDPSKIYKDLIPILRSTPELRWNDRGQVLMATWTDSAYFPDSTYVPGYEFPLYGYTWFTAVPFLQNECKEYNKTSLDLRLKQVLGLPPDADKNVFLQVWIDPIYLFRPCPDPGIGDHECQVRISLVRERPTPGNNEPPWYCPGRPVRDYRPGPAQVSGASVVVSQDHLNWMCDNWKGSYDPPPKERFPWTALGYTYDWGNPADPVGQSEFVAPAQSLAVFDSITPTTEYCSGQ